MQMGRITGGVITEACRVSDMNDTDSGRREERDERRDRKMMGMKGQNSNAGEWK